MIWDFQICDEIGIGCAEAEAFLEDSLRAGWEPFAVTGGASAPWTYHLRHALVLA